MLNYHYKQYCWNNTQFILKGKMSTRSVYSYTYSKAVYAIKWRKIRNFHLGVIHHYIDRIQDLVAVLQPTSRG